MKKYISLFLAALMLLSLLAGCGKKSDGGDGTRTLVLRNTAGLSTNDPHATTNTHDYTVFENIYEGLYDLNEATGGYDLRLAEKVEANDDATEYTVTLKQGVKFHNGETMTADDVVFSYAHAQKDAHMGSYCRPLDHVEKVGTGPYMWDENNYNPLSSWSAVAFEDYHRGKAKIEKITWNVIADDTSAITALQNGELDYMVVPISYWEDIKASNKFNCVEKESNEVMLFCINVESKTHGELLRNDNIRLAMMYALDRDGINKLVCDGYGTPTYMYINPNYAAAAPASDSLKNPIPYNLQKAKELLAQEGYPDGIDIGEFNVAAGRNENFGVAVQAQLEAAGIKSTLVVSDYNVAGDRNVAQEYDICIAYDCGNYDFNNFEQQSSSAAIGLTNVLFNGPSGKFNDLSAKFDEWLKEGSSTADEAKRLEIYTEMYNAYYDTHTQVPLINLPSCVAYSKDLNAIAVPTDYRVYDWSWNS